MGDTKEQVIEYQNRLRELVKRDYIYLFIGLIVVAMSFGFLYTQFNPGKPLTFNTLIGNEDIVNRETFKQTGNIAGLIEEREIDFISPTAMAQQGGLTNPATGEKTQTDSLSSPEEGQTSSIATGPVTNTAKSYTVQEGDNLEYIAGMMYGDREAWPIIAEANGILGNPDAIYAGMVLVIPR